MSEHANHRLASLAEVKEVDGLTGIDKLVQGLADGTIARLPRAHHPHMEISRTDNATVVTINGDFDHYTADRIKKVIAAEIEQRPTKLVVYLSDNAFIDSRGIGVLLNMLALANARECPFVLVPNGALKTALRVLQMLKWFTTASTLEQALAASH